MIQVSKDDARKILEWARTDVGEEFFRYLQHQAEGNTSFLLTATDVDLYRAQGRQHQLRRIYEFFEMAEKIASGEVEESKGPMEPDQVFPDFPAPWGAAMDDSSMAGSD